MKVLGVEQTEEYNQVYKLIEQFRIAAKKVCQTERVRGIVDVEITPNAKLGFHMSNECAHLTVGRQTYLEDVHNLGEVKGERDILPIRIMSLYHKLEGMLINEDITLLHIEKDILELS